MPCDAPPEEGRLGVRVERPRALPGLELAIRVALVAAIAFQVVQRFTYTGYGMSEYGRSLWYVSYEHGFVRRGLAGEALRTIVGDRPTIATIDLVQNVVAVVTVSVMVALIVTLARRRTVIAYAAAGALAVAPFAFDSVGGQRRPDLLAFLLLAAVGLWAGTRGATPTRLALVAGSLLAVCALASEVAPLVVAPWLVLVVIGCARSRSRDARVGVVAALTLVPSACVLVAVAAWGAPSAAQVQALELDAPYIIGGRGSVFYYLGDTLSSSFERVIQRSNPQLSILVGLVLVGLLFGAFRGSVPYVRSLGRWLLPTRIARSAWLISTGALTLALFALGFDWLRWITVVAFAALLALCSLVLIDARARFPSPARDRWRRAVPEHLTVSARGIAAVAAATYLLLLPPLPNFVTNPVVAARLLLDIPK